jgi:hypothetical protein
MDIAPSLKLATADSLNQVKTTGKKLAHLIITDKNQLDLMFKNSFHTTADLNIFW